MFDEVPLIPSVNRCSPAEEGAEGFIEEEEYDGMPPLDDADSLFIELQPID